VLWAVGGLRPTQGGFQVLDWSERTAPARRDRERRGHAGRVRRHREFAEEAGALLQARGLKRSVPKRPMHSGGRHAHSLGPTKSATESPAGGRVVRQFNRGCGNGWAASRGEQGLGVLGDAGKAEGLEEERWRKLEAASNLWGAGGAQGRYVKARGAPRATRSAGQALGAGAGEAHTEGATGKSEVEGGVEGKSFAARQRVLRVVPDSWDEADSEGGEEEAPSMPQAVGEEVSSAHALRPAVWEEERSRTQGAPELAGEAGGAQGAPEAARVKEAGKAQRTPEAAEVGEADGAQGTPGAAGVEKAESTQETSEAAGAGKAESAQGTPQAVRAKEADSAQGTPEAVGAGEADFAQCTPEAAGEEGTDGIQRATLAVGEGEQRGLRSRGYRTQ